MQTSSDSEAATSSHGAKRAVAWVALAGLVCLVGMWTVTGDPLKRVTIPVSTQDIMQLTNTTSGPHDPKHVDELLNNWRPHAPGASTSLETGGSWLYNAGVIKSLYIHDGPTLGRPLFAVPLLNSLRIAGPQYAFAGVIPTAHAYLVYVTPAANAAVANGVTATLVDYLNRVQPGVSYRVIAIGANPPSDPNGYGLVVGLTLFVLAMIGLGVWRGLRRANGWASIVRLLAAVAAMSVVFAAVLRYPLGLVIGPWWHVAGALGLGGLAIGASSMAAALRWQMRGAIAVATLLLVTGMPFLFVPTVWQLTRPVWGQLTQLFPVGAMETMLRQLVFFHSYSITFPVVVLTLWSVGSLCWFYVTPGLPPRRNAHDLDQTPALERIS